MIQRALTSKFAQDSATGILRSHIWPTPGIKPGSLTPDVGALTIAAPLHRQTWQVRVWVFTAFYIHKLHDLVLQRWPCHYDEGYLSFFRQNGFPRGNISWPISYPMSSTKTLRMFWKLNNWSLFKTSTIIYRFFGARASFGRWEKEKKPETLMHSSLPRNSYFFVTLSCTFKVFIAKINWKNPLKHVLCRFFNKYFFFIFINRPSWVSEYFSRTLSKWRPSCSILKNWVY